MFAKQLLKLLNKILEMSQKELAFIEEMRMREAAAISEGKAGLINLYQSCILKIEGCDKTRLELKKSGLLPEIQEKVTLLVDVLSRCERIASQAYKLQEQLVEYIQQEIMQDDASVKSYTKQGIVKKNMALGISWAPNALNTLDQTL